MQCVYYLRLYGSPRQQVAFWTHHALYEVRHDPHHLSLIQVLPLMRLPVQDACSFIIASKLPANLFVEDVFLVALSHAQLPFLLRAIRKIGMWSTSQLTTRVAHLSDASGQIDRRRR